MRFLVEAIGTAVPERRAAQGEILEETLRYAGAEDPKAERTLRALYRRSGIRHRGSVLLEASDDGLRIPFYQEARERRGWPGTGARMSAYAGLGAGLAEAAGRRALESASCDPQSVTRLVFVSCTGFTAPGIDLYLTRALGLSPRVKRAQIGFMGCHGAINGLEVARSMAATAGPGERTLLVALELCSLHAQPGMGNGDVVANAIFADGAAAVVGRCDAGVREGADDAWALVDTRSVRVPDSDDAMTWSIGDRGFRMTLSSRVPDLLERHLAPAVDAWLAEAGLTRGDVRSWAVHPGGVRILEAAGRALGLGPEALDASRRVLREHGNMSSPTVLFVVDEMRRSGGGLPCVLLAFGPGLMVEMARIGGPGPRA